MFNNRRRKRGDRGKDNSTEIDLTLDAIERIEARVADILDIVKDIKEKVDTLER